MGYKNREIELKLVIRPNVSLSYIKNRLYDIYGQTAEKIITGHSKDVYFRAPKGAKADFVRVRYGVKNEASQITIKHTDRKSNKNRVEIDLPIGNPRQAEVLLKRLVGRPVGEIKKRYHVFFLGPNDNISIYQIDGDGRVFVEIEGTSAKKVFKMWTYLKTHLGLEMDLVKKSLFQLFLNGQNAA